MWEQYRALVLAVAAALVLGACWWNGYSNGKQSGAELVRKMQYQGQKAVAKREVQAKAALEKYVEDIAAANSRPVKRVYFCPPAPSVPKTTGGAPSASPTDVDRHDYGPDLREARDALIRYNALIGAVK